MLERCTVGWGVFVMKRKHKEGAGGSRSSRGGAPRASLKTQRGRSDSLQAMPDPMMEALWAPPGGGRDFTLSVAVPGSIVANAQSRELRTYLAGQVGRALALFNVDEVVVYDDRSINEVDSKSAPYGDANTFLARILQYLETPAYLRKDLFPIHEDLKLAGLLNPLDAPHHLKASDSRPYREGIVVNAAGKNGTFLVNCGQRNYVQIDKKLKVGVRVTVELDDGGKSGKAVAPSIPREKLGVYWGYTVRLAQSFQDIFVKSPHPNGYDCAIGISENGQDVHDPPVLASVQSAHRNRKHALVVFGGMNGLESAVEADEQLQVPKEKTAQIFDHYLNCCPRKGSRTMRTEEDMLLALSILAPILQRKK